MVCFRSHKMWIHLLLSDRETQFNQLKELISGGPFVPCPPVFLPLPPCPACPLPPHPPWDPGLAWPVGCSGAEFGSDSSWTLKPNPCRQITDSHHPDTQFQAGADSPAPDHQNAISCWLWPAGGLSWAGEACPGLWAAGLFWARGSVLERESSLSKEEPLTGQQCHIHWVGKGSWPSVWSLLKMLWSLDQGVQ